MVGLLMVYTAADIQNETRRAHDLTVHCMVNCPQWMLAILP